jgi:hypothetical protein
MKNGAWNAVGRNYPKKGLSIRSTAEKTTRLNANGAR